MAEERRFPPPPPPRPNIDNGTNGYNQTGSQVYNQPSTQPNLEQNQSVELSQTTENKAIKKEKQPLDPKVRRVLCIVGAAVSFVVAVVCLVLLFVL